MEDVVQKLYREAACVCFEVDHASLVNLLMYREFGSRPVCISSRHVILCCVQSLKRCTRCMSSAPCCQEVEEAFRWRQGPMLQLVSAR